MWQIGWVAVILLTTATYTYYMYEDPRQKTTPLQTGIVTVQSAQFWLVIFVRKVSPEYACCWNVIGS